MTTAMIVIIISILLCVIYSCFMFFFLYSWKSIPDFIQDLSTGKLTISVIIPARNEETNIEKLLRSICKQNYPADQYEILVIDDHSTDNTADLVKKFDTVKLIQLRNVTGNSMKKEAIATGIAAATGELIVTTDADCVVPENWLASVSNFKNKTNAIFIAAPVTLIHNNSLFEIFQAIDFLVMQGITGAAVHRRLFNMSNGANLAYEKKAFEAVRGFEGIDHIASGDDMLLMQKMDDTFSNRLHYLKSRDAIVVTQPAKSWKDFFQQRIRWASKAKFYTDTRLKLILSGVYLFNLSFPVLFIAGIWQVKFLYCLAGILVLKIVAEFSFIKSLADYFNQRSLIKFHVLLQPVHILYILGAGLLGVFGKYQWKGRTVK